MRDVSAKINSLRTARARAIVHVSPSSIIAIKEGKVPKGDPLPVAKVAAIQAVKATPQLIPYCHTVPIDFVGVEYEMSDTSISIEVTVKSIYKTGVEMEAMAGAMIAALNIYDILKMIDDDMWVGKVTLEDKQGGKSNYLAETGWKFGVLVSSDRVAAGENKDKSGQLLRDQLPKFGGEEAQYAVVPDEQDQIRQKVRDWASEGCDLIVISGGTGLSPRDVTPEAVSELFDRFLPGVTSQVQSYGQNRTPFAMLSRQCAGLIGNTVVLALPGSPSAVQDAIDCLFPYLTHLIKIVGGGNHD